MTKNEIQLFNEMISTKNDYETEKKNSVGWLIGVGILEYCENKFKQAYNNFFKEMNNYTKENVEKIIKYQTETYKMFSDAIFPDLEGRTVSEMEDEEVEKNEKFTLDN